MNYLAHIQLAYKTNTSLLGNFLGDFVKGNDLSHLPLDIQKGVRLHRNIDSFTDSHEIVLSLKKGFPRNIRRMSGVVIDIYFDHLLSLQWHQFNNSDMPTVLKLFYTQLANTPVFVEGRFVEVRKGLLKHQWLHDYRQKEAVIRAFYQIEKRLNFRIAFANEAVSFIDGFEDEMHDAFDQFYPKLINHCEALTSEIDSNKSA